MEKFDIKQFEKEADLWQKVNPTPISYTTQRVKTNEERKQRKTTTFNVNITEPRGWYPKPS
jgi:hypothetical protein